MTLKALGKGGGNKGAEPHRRLLVGSSFRCSCGGDTKVYDSRPLDTNQGIRRRRECMSCLRRFTTLEFAVIDLQESIADMQSAVRRVEKLFSSKNS